jgi:hypothetical protein
VACSPGVAPADPAPLSLLAYRWVAGSQKLDAVIFRHPEDASSPRSHGPRSRWPPVNLESALGLWRTSWIGSTSDEFKRGRKARLFVPVTASFHVITTTDGIVPRLNDSSDACWPLHGSDSGEPPLPSTRQPQEC